MSAISLNSVGLLFPTPTSSSKPAASASVGNSVANPNSSDQANTSINGASSVSLSNLAASGKNPSSAQAYAALTNQPYPTPAGATAQSQQAALNQNLNTAVAAASSGRPAPFGVSSNPFEAIQQLVSAPSSAQIINNTTPFQLAQSLNTSKSPPGSNLKSHRLKRVPSISDLLANNRAWAQAKTASDPSFFKRLVAQQSPAYLWIGCSDSRVPANEIVGLDPGELFVHRNVANLAPPQDANYLSVLQFAIQVLKVSHILVVGHYGCGGVLAALRNSRLGLIDHWLSPIRDLVREHRGELDGLPDEKSQQDRLCELNVLRQIENVAANPFVLEAWDRGAELTIHGWCYAIEDGLVKDLKASVKNGKRPARG